MCSSTAPKQFPSANVKRQEPNQTPSSVYASTAAPALTDASKLPQPAQPAGLPQPGTPVGNVNPANPFLLMLSQLGMSP
jgi:hypothetical protein